MLTAHDSGWILISVEYTTHCYVDFGQSGRKFIWFGAHSNLDVLLLGYDGSSAHKPMCHYTYNHTPMATAHNSELILISVEYAIHCYVDFGRTVCTFICFGAYSNLDVLLLGYDDRNCTSVCQYMCNYTPICI